jgi:quinoprotein glucose dehydrogenase
MNEILELAFSKQPDAPDSNVSRLTSWSYRVVAKRKPTWQRAIETNPPLIVITTLLVAVAAWGFLPATAAVLPTEGLFARTNLLAWCIVPFDEKKRGPEERAQMLEKLGITRLAYDWRAEHIPTFDEEVAAMKRHGVEMAAWWFPGTLNADARAILECIKRNHIHPQLWVMLEGGPHLRRAQAFEITPEAQSAHVERMVVAVKPIAAEAAKLGCQVALYNHGGWFGVPENQIQIVERLKREGITNVGIVYTQHHGHGEVDRFEEVFPKMKPHLLALTLNGMIKDGDLRGHALGTVPLGQGEQDLRLLRIINESGWKGPVGIILEVIADAEARLQDNLDGLDWLVSQLDGRPAGPKPQPRTWTSPAKDYWAIEDPIAREKLPLYQIIPAAKPEELTPANGFPKHETFLTWHRSHGDNGGTRYSALDQINRQNVTNLQVAWTFHTGDGSNYIQCNPIIVDGVMFAPTPGRALVAVDAAKGTELWRFRPEGKPAFRGLIYWPGRNNARKDSSRSETVAGARVMFCAGKFLYALEPKTGQPIVAFGEGGKTVLPGRAQGDFGAASAGPATFGEIIVVPGFEKDVWGFDVVSGKHLWTLHTVPHPGEFGYETWDHTEEYGANCWSGMAVDEARGIAYVTTGSPKNNFIGVNHHGDNLFANCLIALDARTGQRLWHFQEIRHDIWDLDIPAPPNLATITREGKRVDVVAVVTKIGNTLLLDRVTGKPIFPFRLRRAPTSDLRGEVTSPFQPDLELPEPFSKQEFTAADLTDRTEEAAAFALTRFKSATTGWFRPGSEGRANLFFNIDGGAEWTGACVDPETSRLYVSANHIAWLITVFRDDDPRDDPQLPKTRGQVVYETICAQCHGTNRLGIGTAPALRGLRHRLTDEQVAHEVRTGSNAMPANAESVISEPDLKSLLDYLMVRDRPLPPAKAPSERPVYSFSGYPKFFDQEGYPANKPPWGTLNCLDLNTGKLLWKVPLGEHPELTAQGVPKTGTENYGGAIVTAGGLVFCAGTRDQKIRAFDKDTGAELWSAILPWVGNAPPATYQLDGRQFLVIAATGSKLESKRGDAYVAFALPPGKR